MKNFQLVDRGIDVVPLLLALQRQPELWDQVPLRTTYANTPHAGTQDIWVRFKALTDDGDLKSVSDEAYPVWYPAYYKLPQIRSIAYGLMSRVSAAHLGGILITKIPPGGQVLPHSDVGHWHAEFYTTKIFIPLQTNADCINYSGGEQLVMRAGEAWYMNNLILHSVVNGGTESRITLIVSLRVED